MVNLMHIIKMRLHINQRAIQLWDIDLRHYKAKLILDGLNSMVQANMLNFLNKLN